LTTFKPTPFTIIIDISYTVRPLYILILLLGFLTAVDTLLFVQHNLAGNRLDGHQKIAEIAVAGLGLTDLCISTEARYTRHPSISDPVVPFMDHLGAIEHFPSGSFWVPVTPKTLFTQNN